jgi:hypothetical protein
MNKAAMTLRKKTYDSWKRYPETWDYMDYVRASRDRDTLTCMTRKLCNDFEHDLAQHVISSHTHMRFGVMLTAS